MRIWIRTCIHVYRCMYAYIHTPTHIHAYRYTDVQIYRYRYICTHTHDIWLQRAQIVHFLTLSLLLLCLAACVCTLQYLLKEIAGPKCVSLKVLQPEKCLFKPKELLALVIEIFMNLAKHEDFAPAVSTLLRFHMHTYMHVCMCACTCICIHACTHTLHVYMHTYIQKDAAVV